MQVSQHYREKAAQMLRLADDAAPNFRERWLGLAGQWTDLARRVDDEDRMIRDYSLEV